MTKKEDLQRQLQELEAKLLEFQKNEKRTAEDLKEVNTICDQIEELNHRLETEERADKAIAELRRPVGDHADPGQPSDGVQGFGSFGEYLQAVAAASMPRGGKLGGFPTGVYDKRLSWFDPELRSTGLEESTPSLGGFLVQKDFATELLAKAHAASIVYPKTRQITISSNANGIKIPGIDETSRADGSRWGGIRAYWLEEGGSKTASKPKFMLVELNLHKLIGLCYATDELLEDASALEAYVRAGFTEEFSFKIDNAIIRGTGAGQPLGILEAACLVSVTGGSSAGTIVAADVVNMFTRLWPGSQARAEWFANVDCLPELMAMHSKELAGGGAAAGDLVWMPANALSGTPYQSLMGKRLNFIEQCSTVGTVGDLILADFSQYITINKGGMQSASSIHVQFTTDETTFRFVLRIDGQPWWNNTLTPFKGTNTQSPFVAIGTRS